jgi:hypothetical protein
MCEAINNLKAYADDQAIKIQGLDAVPELGIAPCLFDNPFDNNDLYSADGMHITLAKDPQSGHVTALNKVSDQYKLVQHHEALHRTLEAIVNGAPEFGKPEVKLNLNNKGGKMWATMLFPNMIDIFPGDPIKPQCVVTNSADLSKRFSIIFGAFRMLCSNGMVIPDSRFPDHVLIKNLHKMGTLDLDEAISKMMVGFESFSDTLGVWKEYAKIELTKDRMTGILEGAKFSTNQVQNILEQPLRGFETPLLGDFPGRKKANGWKAYNAATQFIADNNVNEGTSLDRNRKVSDSFDTLIATA